jgi:hypothetical protein
MQSAQPLQTSKSSVGNQGISSRGASKRLRFLGVLVEFEVLVVAELIRYSMLIYHKSSRTSPFSH